MEFKDVLNKLLAQGKSKAEIGRLMGVSRTMVYKYLSGESCPSYDAVVSLYRKLDRTVAVIETDLLEIEKRD